MEHPIRPAAHSARGMVPPVVSRPSDLAVDGLLRGLAGGIVMIIFLVGASALAGIIPANVLASFGIEGSVRPLNGLLAHLAVSAVYGILWGFGAGYALRRPYMPYWAWGVLYGALLYGVAVLMVLPTSPLARIPWAILLAAHLLYGGTVGLLHQPATAALPATSPLRP